MQNTSKLKHGNRLKILTLIPSTVFLFVVVAIANGQTSSKEAIDKKEKPFIVVIDPGHGGKDCGTKSVDNEDEKDLTLSITKLLTEKSIPNVKIISTREDDSFVSLLDRVNKAKDANADLFISFHIFSSENNSLSGIRCYTAKAKEFSSKSNEIGKLFINELKQINGIKTNDDPRPEYFFVLRNSNCPALLLSLGFLSNSADRSFLNSRSNQELICNKIMASIEKVKVN